MQASLFDATGKVISKKFQISHRSNFFVIMNIKFLISI